MIRYRPKWGGVCRSFYAGTSTLCPMCARRPTSSVDRIRQVKHPIGPVPDRSVHAKAGVAKMIYFKSCSRCGGDMITDSDRHGRFVYCIQCARSVDLPDQHSAAVWPASRIRAQLSATMSTKAS